MTSETAMANTEAFSKRVNFWPLFLYLEKAYHSDWSKQTLKKHFLNWEMEGKKSSNIIVAH